MSGARYPIGTIEQMAAIPSEARQRFLAELPEIIEAVARATEAHALVNQVIGADVLTLGTPEWVDDDKREATYTVTDGATGERIHSATVKMAPGGDA